MKTLSQNTQKLVNINNLDFGEWGVAENIVMMVLGYDVFCVGFKGTIHELVIVRIGCDKAKMIIHLNHSCIWEVEKGLNDVGCNLRTNLLGKNLFVFGQDLIGNAKSIFAIYEISPDGIVLAATRERDISRQLVSRTMFIIGYMACACVRSSILQ